MKSFIVHMLTNSLGVTGVATGDAMIATGDFVSENGHKLKGAAQKFKDEGSRKAALLAELEQLQHQKKTQEAYNAVMEQLDQAEAAELERIDSLRQKAILKHRMALQKATAAPADSNSPGTIPVDATVIA